MNRIMQGLFFIYFNFSINVETHKIVIFPAFIGYRYLIKGFEEMKDKSVWFEKGVPVMRAMVPFTTISYFNDLIGFSYVEREVAYIFGIISMVACTYIAYLCIRGVNDMEHRFGINLYGSILRKIWTVLAILDFFIYVGGVESAFSKGLSLIGFVVLVLFLIRFKVTKDEYNRIGII